MINVIFYDPAGKKNIINVIILIIFIRYPRENEKVIFFVLGLFFAKKSYVVAVIEKKHKTSFTGQRG